MRMIFGATLLAVLVGMGAVPRDAAAQAGAEPFELALFSPIQVRGPDAEIQILRLSLIYGENISVRGLDIGIVSRATGGVSKGLQYAAVGLVEGDFLGWQNGWIAGITEGVFTGFQGPAAFNRAVSGEAFQFGIVNQAEDLSGFQLGLVNLAQSLYGLQIGLVNIIEDKTSFSFLPIVNWSF